MRLSAGRRLFAALLAPLLIWSGHFLFVYIFLSVGCARGWDALHWAGMDLVRLGLWAATTAAVLPLFALLWALRRSTGFTQLAGLGTALIALVAVTWTLTALPFTGPCQ